MQSHPQLEIVHSSSDLVRAIYRNVYIMRWTGVSTTEDFEAIFADIRRLSAQHAIVAVINILDAGARPPSAEDRERVARHQALLADKLAIANLVDGQGFWASIVLNTLLGIQTMKSKRSERERTFRKPDEAGAWLVPFIDGRATALEITSVVEQVRKATAGADLASAS